VKHPCDEGVLLARSRAVASGRTTPDRSGGWVLAATILGSSLAFIDGTAVNVVLPVLQRELGASAADVQWVVELYGLFLASLLLLGGSLGDRFGRRRVFAIGVFLFTAASVACGFAPGVGSLIVARGVQGIGGALVVPGSLAILSASFQGEARGRAIGTWSGFTAITTAAGPVLGGWLADQASWRWVFFLNVPLAVAVLAISAWHVPESRDEETGAASLDVGGASLATLGLGGLVFGLLESSALGWLHPAVVAALAGGGVALVAFVLVESRVREPMVPLGLFRSRTFLGANVLTLLLYAALGGSLFFVPFDLIQVRGFAPTAAGAALLPLTILLFLLSRWSGGLVGRYGGKLPLVVGPLIAAGGFALFALAGAGGSYWTAVFPAVVVLGTGMAVSVAPLTTVVMGAVEVRHAGTASGINNAVSRLASLLAIALMGVVVVASFERGLDRRLATIEMPEAARRALVDQRDRLAAVRIPSGLDQRTRARVREAVSASFLDGFRRVMLGAAGLAVAGALAAAVMIETGGRRRRRRTRRRRAAAR
jgi:EmrB/QacA subfamily drug resistance transporter